MATTLRSKSFQRNLLLSIGGVFLLFAVCFSVYQYQREKEYKIDILHSRLHMYNYEMVQTLGEDSLTNGRLFRDYVGRHSMEGLRVSIIDRNGRVLLDSYDANPGSLGNHLQRTEIQQALRDGNGYDIKRLSQSTHETYFYSATRFGNLIVRAAVPYSAELTRSLQADNTYIYFAIALTLLLGIVLYLDTALQLHDKGITPSLQVPQHIEVLGDASLIYSIFRNLIDNAISYATGASRLAIVCKEAESEGRHFYEFLVSDNGPGVEPQHLDHLVQIGGNLRLQLARAMDFDTREIIKFHNVYHNCRGIWGKMSTFVHYLNSDVD